MADPFVAAEEETKSRWFWPIVTFLLTLLLYVHTHCPTPYGDFDSLELSAAVAADGLPHPGGYPIYHLLGRLCLALSPYEAAQTLNLMSALFGALTVFVFTLFLGQLLKEQHIAALGGLLLASAVDFWRLSVVAEVYTLHTFLIMLFIFLLKKWVDEQEEANLFAAAFVFAAALGNHATAIFLFPAAVIYLFYNRSFPNAGMTFLCALLVVTIALSAYFLYLPALATSPQAGPFSLLLNTSEGGRPSVSAIWNYITGKVYREQLWSWDNMAAGWTNIIGHTLVQFDSCPYVPHNVSHWSEGVLALLHNLLLLATILGVIFHFQGERKSFFLWALLFLFFSFFYAGMGTMVDDLDSMYLPIYMCLALWATVALKATLLLLRDNGRYKSIICLKIVLCLLMAGRIHWAYQHCNMANYKIMDETLACALKSIPADSTVIADFQNAMLLRYGQVARGLHQSLEVVPYGLVTTAFQNVYEVKSLSALYKNWASRVDLALRMRPRGVYTTLCNPRYLADYSIERFKRTATNDIYKIGPVPLPTFVDKIPQKAIPVDKTFGSLHLAGLVVSTKPIKSNGQFDVTCYWRKTKSPSRAYVFVGVTGPNSAQLRRMSSADKGPWLLWRIGRGITSDKWSAPYLVEKRHIFLPHEASPLKFTGGKYGLALSPPPRIVEITRPVIVCSFNVVQADNEQPNP